jgi:alcohol oxidase
VSCPDADPSLSTLRTSKLIVVSAGALGSPAILERSGIGAEVVLKQCGVKQLVDLPGVGENFRGPLFVSCRGFGLVFLDHNGVSIPYLTTDEVITMDPLWSGKEPAVQGKHVLFIYVPNGSTSQLSKCRQP